MRIKTFGWRNSQLDQITRVEQGFISLGHELVDENPDIIYCNNDFYDEPLKYSESYPGAKKIFNVLDLQIGNGFYDLNKLKEQLLRADFVTCISEFVKNEIKEFLNIDATNIGNPIKDVSIIVGLPKQNDFIIVGRNADKNKRGYIFEQMLSLPDNKDKTFAVIGSEPLPHTADGWVGVLNDKDLNEMYNFTKFVICPSKREGLNLVMIEALITSIPIVAKDMTTSYLVPEIFTCEPTAEAFNDKVRQLEENYSSFRALALEYGMRYAKEYNKNTIAQNIINLCQ